MGVSHRPGLGGGEGKAGTRRGDVGGCGGYQVIEEAFAGDIGRLAFAVLHVLLHEEAHVPVPSAGGGVHVVVVCSGGDVVVMWWWW